MRIRQAHPTLLRPLFNVTESDLLSLLSIQVVY
jgi:hypothetical protein